MHGEGALPTHTTHNIYTAHVMPCPPHMRPLCSVLLPGELCSDPLDTSLSESAAYWGSAHMLTAAAPRRTKTPTPAKTNRNGFFWFGSAPRPRDSLISRSRIVLESSCFLEPSLYVIGPSTISPM